MKVLTAMQTRDLDCELGFRLSAGMVHFGAMPKIVLNVEQKDEPGGTTRFLHLESRGTRQTIYFRLDGVSAPHAQVLDAFVLAVLLHAMGSAADLHVKGALTRRFLQNLTELQGVWRSWRPDRYTPIEVSCDQIVDSPEPRGRGAIATFSGGIDSTFTAWRHAEKKLGNGSYDLKDVLLVHGFDVHLKNAGAFQQLVRRISPVPNALGLRLRTITTNLKEAKLQDWEDSHGMQVGCCLHQYSHEFQQGIIAATGAYNAFIVPWGSTPVTDPLMCGGEMAIAHDGAAFTRPEKLLMLLQSGLALQGLKVCWEGLAEDRNCGRCEKCIRTHLSFLAGGIAAPCFDEPFREKDLESLVIDGRVPYEHLCAVYDQAVANGKDSESWAILLKSKLDAYKPLNAAQKVLWSAKRRARRFFQKR